MVIAEIKHSEDRSSRPSRLSLREIIRIVNHISLHDMYEVEQSGLGVHCTHDGSKQFRLYFNIGSYAAELNLSIGWVEFIPISEDKMVILAKGDSILSDPTVFKSKTETVMLILNRTDSINQVYEQIFNNNKEKPQC